MRLRNHLKLLLLSVLGPALMAACFGPGNRDPHGPRDVQSYIRHLERPERDAYQHPEEVVKALSLQPNHVVADVGSGPGYFTRRLARAVPQGVVYAVDVEPAQLDRLNEHLDTEGIKNVVPVLATVNNPRIPPKSMDLLLVVNTYHHFDERPAYLRGLRETLRPGGRLVVIDFYRRPLPVGPPPEHKLAKDVVIQEASEAGFQLLDEPRFLPYQYFLIFGPSGG